MKHAGGDLAFVANSSAFAVTERDADLVRVLDLFELKPTKTVRLKPSEVYEQAADFLGLHGVTSIMLDGHYVENAREKFGELGIRVVDAPGSNGKVDVHLEVKRLFAEGKLRLPAHTRLLAQLKATRVRALAGGKLQISSPTKGRAHGDVASAAILAIYRAMTAPKPNRYTSAAPGTCSFEESTQCAVDGSELEWPMWARYNTRR